MAEGKSQFRLADYDLVLLLMVVALTSFGIVMVYSASSVMAAKNFHDGAYFLKRQGLFALVGFSIAAVVMRVDYHHWRKLAVPALLVCLALLVLVLIPEIGAKVKGASRWIRLPGFNLQPSEFAKIALILYMAYSLEKKCDKIKSLSYGFLPYMVVLTIMLLLILKQPDLGAALTLAAVTVLMLFAAGTRLVFLLGTAMMAAPIVAYLIFHSAYRLRRIKAFMNPEQDPTGIGWQIIQSKYAFGAGGLFGQGLGEGKQKLFYLPEAHTDFILSVVGEELGFVGVLVIVGMFFILIQRAMRIALAARDPFGRFLALGIAVLFAIEAVVNMGVVTGLLPTKGLALPFISYGGSSLLISLLAVGILLNISSGLKLTPITEGAAS
ncbi:MAG: putative lipid II flippase FtsW [Trichlorobacter sp.]|jgi:cell division protein FtsW